MKIRLKTHLWKYTSTYALWAVLKLWRQGLSHSVKVTISILPYGRLSHSQALSASDNPRYLPYPCIKSSPPKFSRFFISGDSWTGSARADNHIMYIKSIIDQILDIVKDIDPPNRVGSRGYQVPDEGSVRSRLHKVQWWGCIKSNLFEMVEAWFFSTVRF